MFLCTYLSGSCIRLHTSEMKFRKNLETFDCALLLDLELCIEKKIDVDKYRLYVPGGSSLLHEVRREVVCRYSWSDFHIGLA